MEYNALPIVLLPVLFSPARTVTPSNRISAFAMAPILCRYSLMTAILSPCLDRRVMHLKSHGI